MAEEDKAAAAQQKQQDKDTAAVQKQQDDVDKAVEDATRDKDGNPVPITVPRIPQEGFGP